VRTLFGKVSRYSIKVWAVRRFVQGGEACLVVVSPGGERGETAYLFIAQYSQTPYHAFEGDSKPDST